MDTTIVAIATAHGQGGIGIVRVSGPAALSLVASLFRPYNEKSWAHRRPRQLYLGTISDQGLDIDQVMCVYMPSPRSYTGEDVVEIHSHGGSLVLHRILSALLKQGAVMAEAGEFTKRAFLNGRLDLVQAESVIDIIEANNNQGLTMALSQLKGNLSEEIERLAQILKRLIAFLEASLDFPEDEIDRLDDEIVSASVTEVEGSIQRLLATYQQGRLYKDGIRTAIIGRPNVGKSSLLNVLLQESRAIVTDMPGTTRDTIEEVLNLGSLCLRVVDTAGIRETVDEVEMMGVAKSIEVMQEADLILWVLDAQVGLTPQDEMLYQRIERTGTPVLALWNKIDLVDPSQMDPWPLSEVDVVHISAKYDTGLDKLLQKIEAKLTMESMLPVDGKMITRYRHYQLLLQAEEDLQAYDLAVASGLPLDFQSIDLRSAYDRLNEILGKEGTEEIFDLIFKEFCLGK